MKIKALTLAIFAAVLEWSGTASAGELGHYGPALPDARDLLVPPTPGFYFKEYDYFYTSDQFRNRKGDKVSSVQLPGGATVNIDPDVDIFVLAPTFMWVSDWKVLGAHYAAYITPTLGNSSVGASLTTQTGLGVSAEQSDFGIGDLFVQPLWLGWNLTHWDFSTGYGFYAPIGKFDANAADNIGLGFWTHQFQGAVAWYPWADRTTAFTGGVTYEINQEVEDTDVTPGQRVSVNLGFSQYVPLKAPGLLLELGAVAYGQWQVTDDTGSDAVRPDVHDRIFGLGPQIGLTYVPWNAAATFKFAHEIGAEDRFQGENLTLNFAVGF